MENCEDHVKVATRQKVREFCNQLMESFSKESPPIYLLATIVDVNKADNFDTEKTVQVINYLFSLRQPCLVASLMFRYFKFVMSILKKKSSLWSVITIIMSSQTVIISYRVIHGKVS